jgi:endonuclease/exonuclease/phosphatase family metal-dependent hydrolase
MATTITALTFNTHLFGEWTSILGTGWADQTRVQQLAPLLERSGADIIGLQEIWSSRFVKDGFRDSTTGQSVPGLVERLGDSYPNSYFDLHDVGVAHPSNPSGLLLLMNKRVQPDPKQKPLYYDYIHRISGAEYLSIPDGLHGKDVRNLSVFDPIQDMPTGKGFLMVPVVVDGTLNLTLVVTHMPTSSGTFPVAIDACFRKLDDHTPEGDSPVLLLADFNVSETDGRLESPVSKYQHEDRYNLWIGPNAAPNTDNADRDAGKAGPTLLRKGFRDAFRTLNPTWSAAPGYSVIGATNTCWRNFNNDKVKGGHYDASRIDHMMYRGLTPLSMTVLGTPPPAAGAPSKTNYLDDPGNTNANTWIWTDGNAKNDMSDHYPVIGQFSF